MCNSRIVGTRLGCGILAQGGHKVNIMGSIQVYGKVWYHSPEMVESKAFEIGEIERNFFIKGPVGVACQPKGFNRWCTLPYPSHKHGCPNFGKSEGCPPLAPYFLDVYKPEVFVAFMRFDFGQYLEKKRHLHPDWTLRALVNPRHFQGHLDSKLRSFVDSELIKPDFENFYAVHNTEAMGVNMHLTVRKAGVELEWPPRKNMYRVTLLAQFLEQPSCG